MKKIFLILFLIIQASLAGTILFAQSTDGLRYEMVSYSQNSKDASTPFFNLAFFNQPYFTINYQSFSNAWQFIFDLIIGISIATAVIVFMYNAFQGIVSGGNPSELTKARAGMQNAVIGLMIILSTWLIINTINPDLLRLPIFQGLDKISDNNNTQSSTQSSGTTAESLPNNN